MRVLSAILFLFVFLAVNAHAQITDLAGDWNTSLGYTKVTAIEGGYDLTYEGDGGGRARLMYTVSGDLEGIWSEGRSDEKCETKDEIYQSYYWGRLQGELNPPNGRSPILVWSYCQSEDYGSAWHFFSKIHPRAPSTTPLEDMTLTGNWIVNWADSEEDTGYISLYKKFELGCPKSVDRWCRKVEYPGNFLEMHGGQKTPGQSGHPGAQKVLANGNFLNVKWKYDFLNLWGGNSALEPVDIDNLSGEWQGDGKGKETWQRVYSRVKETAGVTVQPDGLQSGPRKPLGDKVTLKTNYLSEASNLRGNRPRVFLNLYGENMWGVHDFTTDYESGLEITETRYICSNGNTVGHRNFNKSCLNEGGVVGTQFELVVWYWAAPGQKHISYDGRKIPFNLEVKNWPASIMAPPLVTQTDTSLRYAVLLDDQMSQRQEEGARVKNYSYPFTPSGERTRGLDTRLLAVVGKNLTQDGEIYLSSEDPKLNYDVVKLPTNIQSALERAAISLSGMPLQTGEKLIPVRATLKADVRPGVKTLKVNGETANWSLLFADQLGTIGFLRQGTTPNDPRENKFYVGETVRIGIKALSDNLPIDKIEVVLEAEKYPALSTSTRNASRRLGTITLTRTEDIETGQNFAVGPPLLIQRLESETIINPTNVEHPIAIGSGEKLVVRPLDRFALLTIPPVASADVVDKPRRSGLWQLALDRVAACPGVGGDSKSSTFPKETSAVFENWVLTQAVANIFNDGSGTRRTRITKGDHAALILIRDELLPIVKAENEKLRPYLGNMRNAQKYWSEAKANPRAKESAFWKYNTYSRSVVDIPSGTTISYEFTLADTLDLEKLKQKTKLDTIVEARDLANRAVARKLSAQYRETNEAFRRGRNAGNCNLEELLVIAGQKSDSAILKLLPDLVKLEGQRWRPDTAARRYVQTVNLLGAEVRAMDAYAKLDNAYKSMAIAVVAAPLTWAGGALAASGATTSSYLGSVAAGLAVGADLFDMAYFGRQGVEDFLKGEEDYFTAIGLSPVLGADIVKEAEGNRDNGLAAVTSIILPGLGVLGGVSTLKDIRKIEKGRNLVRNENALSRLDELDDVEKTDVLAYYKSLQDTEASSTSRLFAAEKDDFAKFETLIENSSIQSKTNTSSADSFDDLDFGGGTFGKDDATTTTPPSPIINDEATATVPPPSSSLDETTKTVPPTSSIDESTGTVPPPGVSYDEATGTFPPPGPMKADEGSFTDVSGIPENKATPKEQPELSPSHMGAPDSPYKEKVGETFDQAKPYNGKMVGHSDEYGRLPAGTKIETGETSDDIVFGELLSDKGGFTNVYKDKSDPGFVIKERFLPDESGNFRAKNAARRDPESMEGLIHDSEVGRSLLVEAAKDSSVFRVAKRKGEPVWVRDKDSQGGRYIYREESLADEVENGVIVTNAKDRFAARPNGGPTRAESLTIQMAVRELNQKGIVWTDSKLSNLDVIPDASSPTGYKVVYFDYDGFRPMKGDTPLARWRNARKTQQRIDNLSRRDDWLPTVTDLLREAPFDYRAFGKEMFPPPMSAFNNKTGADYSRLNQLPPDEFYKEAESIVGKSLFGEDQVKRASQYDPFGSETVKVNPNSTKPDEAATQIGPATTPANHSGTSSVASPRELPPGQVDLWERNPGARLLERGITREDIDSIIEKSRRGVSLSVDEQLDMVDFLRVQRSFREGE